MSDDIYSVDVTLADIAAFKVLADAAMDHTEPLLGVDQERVRTIIAASNALIALLCRLRPVGRGGRAA